MPKVFREVRHQILYIIAILCPVIYAVSDEAEAKIMDCRLVVAVC